MLQKKNHALKNLIGILNNLDDGLLKQTIIFRMGRENDYHIRPNHFLLIKWCQ